MLTLFFLLNPVSLPRTKSLDALQGTKQVQKNSFISYVLLEQV